MASMDESLEMSATQGTTPGVVSTSEASASALRATASTVRPSAARRRLITAPIAPVAPTTTAISLGFWLMVRFLFRPPCGSHP